jgi:hypothetical protein
MDRWNTEFYSQAIRYIFVPAVGFVALLIARLVSASGARKRIAMLGTVRCGECGHVAPPGIRWNFVSAHVVCANCKGEMIRRVAA